MSFLLVCEFHKGKDSHYFLKPILPTDSISINDQRSTPITFHTLFVVRVTLPQFSSVHFSSATQSCQTLCNPMDCNTPSFPVITSSWSLLKLVSTKSVMPSNHLILYYPLSLLLSIFPSIGVFSNESVLHIKNLPHSFKELYNIPPYAYTIIQLTSALQVGIQYVSRLLLYKQYCLNILVYTNKI